MTRSRGTERKVRARLQLGMSARFRAGRAPERGDARAGPIERLGPHGPSQSRWRAGTDDGRTRRPLRAERVATSSAGRCCARPATCDVLSRSEDRRHMRILRVARFAAAFRLAGGARNPGADACVGWWERDAESHRTLRGARSAVRARNASSQRRLDGGRAYPGAHRCARCSRGRRRGLPREAPALSFVT